MIWLYVASWFLVGWGGMFTLFHFGNDDEHYTVGNFVILFGLGLFGPIVPILFGGCMLYLFLKDHWDTVLFRRTKVTKTAVAHKLTGEDL